MFNIAFIIDIFMVVDICLHMVTAYQKDVKWETDVPVIMMNYIMKDTFIFDVASTLPVLLIQDYNSNWYFMKIIRIIHTK